MKASSAVDQVVMPLMSAASLARSDPLPRPQASRTEQMALKRMAMLPQ